MREDPDTNHATIDWKDPEAVRELTRVMLRHDFGIEWNVPLNRLCPPVPNRLNYVCWLADLMKLRDGGAKGGAGKPQGREACSNGGGGDGPVVVGGGDGQPGGEAMQCDDETGEDDESTRGGSWAREDAS